MWEDLTQVVLSFPCGFSVKPGYHKMKGNNMSAKSISSSARPQQLCSEASYSVSVYTTSVFVTRGGSLTF